MKFFTDYGRVIDCGERESEQATKLALDVDQPDARRRNLLKSSVGAAALGMAGLPSLATAQQIPYAIPYEGYDPRVFPDIPFYDGWRQPHRVESDLADMEVVYGEVPADMNGTIYRCGPDRQFPPIVKDDIFIDGEGVAHMIRFDNGRVSYRNRWVRNTRFLLQEAAGRSLFGRYRNRYTNDPSVAGISMNASNTNIVWHAGRLLVLKEDSLPVEIDKDTFEVIQENWDYDGQVTSETLSAHPKLDLRRDELITYGVQARGDATTDVAFYIIDGKGKVKHEVWFNAPYPGVVHDFAVSDEHIVFPFYPLITDLDVIKRGGPFYEWYPEQHSYVAILPRYGSAEDIRWFRGPAVSAGHMMGAVTEGSKVHMDVCLTHGNCFEFFPSHDGSPFEPGPLVFTRQTFDLAGSSETWESTRLIRDASEMPRIDDRFIGKNYRHGFMLAFGAGGRGVGHLDYQTREFRVWYPEGNSGCQEAIFVPRRPDSPEGDGYLVVPVNRLDEMRNDIVILDAQKVDAGPVAVIRMTTRIRESFHGCWVPAQALASGNYDMYADYSG